MKSLVTLVLMLIGATAVAQDLIDEDMHDVHVAMLDLESADPPECFSDLFLHLVRYETDIDVSRTLDIVRADSTELFAHPFAFLAGEGSFELTDAEVLSLRTYVLRGGTLVFSPSCSNEDFAIASERAMQRILPENQATVLPMDHPVFLSLFEIPSLVTTDQSGAELRGIEIDGRVRVFYTPQGTSGVDDAGGGCCCCGTTEIRQSRFLNANLLVYSLLP